MKYIAHLKDDEIVRRYPMEKDTYSIGRSKDNDLVFDHPKVSRNHAKIFKQNGQYVIQDLNSTNYVFVNGVRIKQKQLEPQDKIQISSDIHLIFGEETGPDPRTNTVVDLHRHFIHKDDLLRLKKGHPVDSDPEQPRSNSAQYPQRGLGVDWRRAGLYCHDRWQRPDPLEIRHHVPHRQRKGRTG